MYEVTVDPKLQSLIPPLPPEEYAQLEANILKDGCREPLSVIEDVDDDMNPFYVILDGHNRYEICEAHGIKYELRLIKGLTSQEDVRLWIINNQLGRRNLTPEQVAYYRGEQYKTMKAGVRNPTGRNQHSEPVGEQSQPAGQQSIDFPPAAETAKTGLPSTTASTPSKEVWGQNDPKPQTLAPTEVTGEDPRAAEILAEAHGISPSTVKRDSKFAEAVNRLASFLGQDWQRRVLAGTTNLTKADIIALAEQPDKRIKVMADANMDVKRCARTVRREKKREEEKNRPIQLELSFVDSWRSRVCEAKDALDNGDQDTVSLILTELLDQLEKVMNKNAA